MPTIDCGHGNGKRNRLPHLAGSIVWRSRWGRRFACRWKLISIAHPNPENGYAPAAQGPIHFENKASEAGVNLVLENSPTPWKHLTETMPGGAVFDYNFEIGRAHV